MFFRLSNALMGYQIVIEIDIVRNIVTHIDLCDRYA